MTLLYQIFPLNKRFATQVPLARVAWHFPWVKRNARRPYWTLYRQDISYKHIENSNKLVRRYSYDVRTTLFIRRYYWSPYGTLKKEGVKKLLAIGLNLATP